MNGFMLVHRHVYGMATNLWQALLKKHWKEMSQSVLTMSAGWVVALWEIYYLTLYNSELSRLYAVSILFNN